MTGALLLVALLLPYQQLPRDVVARETAGTASLSGTLTTDEQTPQPIPRARIDLSAEGQIAKSTVTNARGEFAFNGLREGRYTLTASKLAFVRTTYGSRRPGLPGTGIAIADGQRVANLQVKMSRGSVITGTIRDELEQPAPGVSVRAMQYRVQNGERILAPAQIAGGLVDKVTDDRGGYRIYGLAAGEYFIMASPRPLANGDLKQMTPGPAAARTVTYAAVYYPNTTSAAAAMPIVIGTGEERTGVDVALQLVRTARIEGVVTAPGGASPQAADLLMLPSSPVSGPMMVSMNRVRPDADGKFSYSGIAPGKYTISARMASNRYWASADVTVDGDDISGIALDLQPGLTLSGRVTVEGSGAPDLSTAVVSLVPGSFSFMMIGIGGEPNQSITDAEGRFTLGNVIPGKYRVDARLGVPGGGWTLKSAVVKGRDSLDFPFEVEPNDKIGEAVVTFTNQTQEVTGTLQDASGRPAPDFTIVIFPADKTYWSATRRIRTARPATDGRFLVPGLPAGEYRIAALVDLAPGEATDPGLLDQLVPASVAFSLRDGERKVQDIKIAAPSASAGSTSASVLPRNASRAAQSDPHAPRSGRAGG